MTDDHLSLDDLAELDEGLLPPERTSAIRAHLHGCEQCQARAASITATREQLSSLPAVSMPADVKTRLDQALAAERSAASADVPSPRAEDTDEGADEGADETDDAAVVDLASRTPNVVPQPGSVVRPRFGRPSLPAIAVAATFVLAGGAIVIGHNNRSSSSDAGGSGGASITAGTDSGGIVAPNESAANLTITSTGTTYTTTGIGQDVQGLLGSARTLDTTGQPTTSPESTAPSNGTSVPGSQGSGSNGGTSAGKTSTKGHKNKRKSSRPAPAPVQEAGGSASFASDQPVPKALKSLAGSRNKILACARTITGQLDAVPLTVDFARWTNPPLYKHAPSAIFIFRSPKPDTVVVYVTNPSCSGNDVVREFAQVPLS